MAVDLHNKITVSGLETLFRNILDSLWSGKASPDKLPPLMVWGAPGLGKSTVIRELAKEYKVGFIDVRLAQREPVDIRGLPVPTDHGVEWQVSAEWPRDPKSKGIILFDELTASDRSLQVAAYEFILDRRLGDLYKVPDGWYICAAGNRTEDRAVSTTMSSALANRFLHVELENNADNWLEWAVKNDIHPSVSGFIRFRPGMLFNQENENLERGWPTPRSWERVSTMMKVLPDDESLIRHTVYGLVGNRAGVEFIAFHKTAQNLDIKEMMLDTTKKVVIPQQADLRYALCAGVAYYLWRGKDEAESRALLDGFYRISLELSSDFAAMLMMDIMESGKACNGSEKLYKHPLFKEWEKKHGKTFRAAAKK
jgi:MoxR-like ATPase